VFFLTGRERDAALLVRGGPGEKTTKQPKRMSAEKKFKEE